MTVPFLGPFGKMCAMSRRQATLAYGCSHESALAYWRIFPNLLSVHFRQSLAMHIID